MILQRLWAILTLPVLLITVLTTPKAQDTETADHISSNLFILFDALMMGQGITTDGEYYYVSGSITALNLTSLVKISADDMEKVDKSIKP